MQLSQFVFEKHPKCATFACCFLNKTFVVLFKLRHGF